MSQGQKGSNPLAAWRIGRPAQAAIILVLAGIYLMMDDAGALIEQAMHAPWMLGPRKNWPVGTWQGALDVTPGGLRQLTLRLEPDMLSDADSRNSHAQQKRLLLPSVAHIPQYSLSAGRTDRHQRQRPDRHVQNRGPDQFLGHAGHAQRPWRRRPNRIAHRTSRHPVRATKCRSDPPLSGSSRTRYTSLNPCSATPMPASAGPLQ